MYSEGSPETSKEKAEGIAFNESIDRELRMAKEPSADGFKFEFMGHGSLLEQANAYVMYEFAGRRIDEQFLRDASMLLMSCINKTCRYYGIIEKFIAYYAIESIPSFSDQSKPPTRRLIVRNRYGSNSDVMVQHLS
jgi:hypothetical protein